MYDMYNMNLVQNNQDNQNDIKIKVAHIGVKFGDFIKGFVHSVALCCILGLIGWGSFLIGIFLRSFTISYMFPYFGVIGSYFVWGISIFFVISGIFIKWSTKYKRDFDKEKREIDRNVREARNRKARNREIIIEG